MTKQEFIKNFRSPLPSAVLKKHPAGHIMQYWAENPQLYSSYFAKGDDYSRETGGHSGIDIATFHRDEVRAAHDGRVTRVVYNSMPGGNMVYVTSYPFFSEKLGRSCYGMTVYAHMDADMPVREWQSVNAGDVLGYESNSGFVVSGRTPYWGNAPAGKGVHLHFGYYEYYLDTREPVFKNPLGNSGDPLIMILQDSPNVSGLQIWLENVQSYLRLLSRRIGA